MSVDPLWPTSRLNDLARHVDRLDERQDITHDNLQGAMRDISDLKDAMKQRVTNHNQWIMIGAAWAGPVATLIVALVFRHG